MKVSSAGSSPFAVIERPIPVTPSPSQSTFTDALGSHASRRAESPRQAGESRPSAVERRSEKPIESEAEAVSADAGGAEAVKPKQDDTAAEVDTGEQVAQPSDNQASTDDEQQDEQSLQFNVAGQAVEAGAVQMIAVGGSAEAQEAPVVHAKVAQAQAKSAPLQQAPGEAPATPAKKIEAPLPPVQQGQTEAHEQSAPSSTAMEADHAPAAGRKAQPGLQLTPVQPQPQAVVHVLGPGTQGAPAETVAAQPSFEALAPQSAQIEDDANVARVMRGLNGAVNQNGGAVNIRLTPPELGTVRIQMEVVRGVVTAQLTAEHDSVRTLLTHQISQLRHALESQGLVVDRLDVQTAPQAQAGGFHRDPPGQSNQNNPGPDDGRSRGQFTHDQDRPRQQHSSRQPDFLKELLDMVA